jgi:hypothetical protein
MERSVSFCLLAVPSADFTRNIRWECRKERYRDALETSPCILSIEVFAPVPGSFLIKPDHNRDVAGGVLRKVEKERAGKPRPFLGVEKKG